MAASILLVSILGILIAPRSAQVHLPTTQHPTTLSWDAHLVESDEISAEKRIGCFSFSLSSTVLSVKTQEVVGSMAECKQRCQTRKATYAGMRYGSECFCGDNHDHTVNGEQLSDSSCTTLCNDHTPRCGGQFSIVIYSVCSRGHYRDNTNDEYNCDASCNCEDNGICLYNTGACPGNCKTGWSGEACNMRVHLPATQHPTTQPWDAHLVESDEISAEKRIGCFSFSLSSTVLSEKTQEVVGSMAECKQRCQTRRATYAGMRYGFECFCGDSHDHTVNGEQLSDSSCTTLCNDHTPRCGGQFSIVIYSVCSRGLYRDNTNDEYNCDASCNCEDNGICLYNTGSCPGNCKTGWSGEACNMRVHLPATQHPTTQPWEAHLVESDEISV